MELKKSYKGLVVWFVLFSIANVGAIFLPLKDMELLGRIINNICSLSITLLMFLMYKTEHVYWLRRATYEEAVEAGSERRKEFAKKHLVRFGAFAAVFFGFSALSYVMQMSWDMDMMVMWLGLIVTGRSTMKFKL